MATAKYVLFCKGVNSWNVASMKILFIRLNKNCFHTSTRLLDHYSALGLSPKSNHAEIKAAYYKLSKLYHPDINSNEEAVKKFRAINDAYEILGNVKLRKLYDKGALRLSTYDYNSHTKYDDDKENVFSKKNVPTHGGKTPIYDFDAWTKEHYSSNFNRQQFDRSRQNERKTHSVRKKSHEVQIGKLFVIPGLILLAVMCDFILPHNQDITDESNYPSDNRK